MLSISANPLVLEPAFPAGLQILQSIHCTEDPSLCQLMSIVSQSRWGEFEVHYLVLLVLQCLQYFLNTLGLCCGFQFITELCDQ